MPARKRTRLESPSPRIGRGPDDSAIQRRRMRSSISRGAGRGCPPSAESDGRIRPTSSDRSRRHTPLARQSTPRRSIRH